MNTGSMIQMIICILYLFSQPAVKGMHQREGERDAHSPVRLLGKLLKLTNLSAKALLRPLVLLSTKCTCLAHGNDKLKLAVNPDSTKNTSGY